jgi:hypothetical protein
MSVGKIPAKYVRCQVLPDSDETRDGARLRVAQILHFSTPLATIGGWLKAYVFGNAYYLFLLRE